MGFVGDDILPSHIGIITNHYNWLVATQRYLTLSSPKFGGRCSPIFEGAYFFRWGWVETFNHQPSERFDWSLRGAFVDFLDGKGGGYCK